MATTEAGAVSLHGATVSTTAETWALTDKVLEVRVTNQEAVGGETVYVTVVTGRTAAAAEAAIVTAVAAADETIAIVPQATKTVFKSSRKTYVAGSIIGNVSTYSIEGSKTGF
jgi:hypothetical protein